MKRMSNHALLFIGAGLYLALGGIAGFVTINAILLLWLAIDRFRQDRNRLAMILIAVCALVLVVQQIGFVIVIVLISLGIYYLRARPQGAGNGESRHRLVLNMRQDRQSWVLHSMSFWHAFGEIRLDLSLAIPEEKETVIVLQGIVGNIDLIVPEDYGLDVEASTLLGQVGLGKQTEGGFLHRVRWRSPDYESKEQKVKLQLFYLVGNIRIRPI
ncbi:cell wall-active antibiotics response protein [Cohnella sp. CBP 2801]|uniref:Cell wall-active antibiotics response protein n=2 Tax=Cohnella zeiphila TaxID=2761120 RepID=A0A7X0SVU4_9BACL|nr:cell wall-active antibiotics response protein [Cohnella zeiphila]